MKTNASGEASFPYFAAALNQQSWVFIQHIWKMQSQESELQWYISLQSFSSFSYLKFVHSLALLDLTRLPSFVLSFITLCQRWHFCSWQNYMLWNHNLSPCSPLYWEQLLSCPTEESATEASAEHFSSCWRCLLLICWPLQCLKALSEMAWVATVQWQRNLAAFATYSSHKVQMTFTRKINI